MNQIFDLTSWKETFSSAASEVGASAVGFLPKLVGAFLILLLGWLLSWGLEVIARRALRAVGLDRLANRLRLAEMLERAGIGLTLSQIVAKLVFWVLLLAFVLSSVDILGLSALSVTVDRLVAFLPRVIGAVLLGVGGLLLGRLIAALVSSAAAAAGFDSAPRLGFLAQALVVGLVLLAAVEQLGVATEVLVLPLTAAVSVAGLAIGVAFALGARPVVTHIMAGHFLKQTLPRKGSIEIDGERGLVERVGAVDTLLRSDDKEWTVPNAQLLERVVVR